LDRLGGTQSRSVDVRIIAATNRDLEQACADGSFRRDLYYRLAVVPIRIPALRERGDDVLRIAEHLLERFRTELRKPRLKLAPDAVNALRAHSWPGNVRELQNLLERAAILYDDEITAAQLGIAANVRAAAADMGAVSNGDSLPELAAQAVKNVERAKIEATLRECRWNKNAAAEKLGVSYKTLLNKIHAYGLD
ncbi:MAG: sigma 54-interacting transcriptional regulator, partial [Terriglobales bacterium]